MNESPSPSSLSETQEAKRRVEDDIRAGNKEEKGGKGEPVPFTKRRRVRTSGIERNPSGPTPSREIWKDMVTNELGNVVEHYTIFKDDEGNKVRVIRFGDRVFVQNEVSQQAFKRGDDNNVLLWLGTVMEIRSDVNACETPSSTAGTWMHSGIIRGFGWESKIENAIGWSQVGTLAVTEEGVTADAITSNLSIEEKVDVFEQVREVLRSIEGVYECNGSSLSIYTKKKKIACQYYVFRKTSSQDSAHFSSMMDQVSSQLALTRLDSDISQAAVDRFLTSEIFSEPIPKPFIDLRSSSTAGVDGHEEESRTEGDFASLDPDVSQAAVDHFLSNGIFSEDIPTSFRASGGSSPVHEIQSECDVSSDEDLGRLDGEVSDSAIDRYLSSGIFTEDIPQRLTNGWRSYASTERSKEIERFLEHDIFLESTPEVVYTPDNINAFLQSDVFDDSADMLMPLKCLGSLRKELFARRSRSSHHALLWFDRRKITEVGVDEDWRNRKCLGVLGQQPHLAPDVWLEAQEIEAYLSQRRYEMPRKASGFFCAAGLLHEKMRDEDEAALEIRIDPDDLEGYRSVFGYDRGDGCQLVGTVINSGNMHWFAFVVDRREGRNAAYIFGQGTRRMQDTRAFPHLRQFRGYLVFRILCALHGWDDRGPDIVIRSDWTQLGGTECGVFTALYQPSSGATQGDTDGELRRVMDICERCRREAAVARQDPAVGPPLKASGHVTAKDMVKSYPELRGLKARGMIRTEEDSDENEEVEGNKKPKGGARRYRVNLNQSSATARRYGTAVEAPVLVEIRRTEQLHGWDDSFDQYEGGPTISAIARLAEEFTVFGDVGTIYFPGSTNQNPLSAHQEYSDRGWRLPAGFCQAFFKHRPVKLDRYLIPDIDYGTVAWPSFPVRTVGLLEMAEYCKEDPMIALTGVLPKKKQVPWDKIRHLRIDIENSMVKSR
ncbi:hypothetical protein DFJ43DRAFT_1044749 [Lentinula guzmanii]|uniref:Ubiquitin-like protease family profile domain-containing protein n=1 Tax=Lentinula guzmanii TaxID=2804957 RepID=A0AA38MTS2_9AGAR|nr:hypothetical protein DFJ43DRAFT_1044749 [Lentinula guzmanii]